MEQTIKTVNRYTICIGLNDSGSYKQEYETEKILSIVARCCREYKMAYSCTIQTGGYIDSNGKFVTENSLALSFVDGYPEKVNEIAKDICLFLNQESVLVTVDKISRYYVSEKIERKAKHAKQQES